MAVLVRLAAMLGGEVLVRRVGVHLGGVLVLVLVREPEMLKPAVRLIVGDMVVTVGVHHYIVLVLPSRLVGHDFAASRDGSG